MNELEELAAKAILESQIKGERSIAKVRLVLIGCLFAFMAYIFIESVVVNGLASELVRPIYYIELLCAILSIGISFAILRITSKGVYMPWMRFFPSFVEISCVAAIHWAIASTVNLSYAFTGATAWMYVIFLAMAVLRYSPASVLFTGAYATLAFGVVSFSAFAAMGNFAEGANIYRNGAGRSVKLDIDDEIVKMAVILVITGLLAFVSRAFNRIVADQIRARIDREKAKASVTGRAKSIAVEIGQRSNDLEEVSSLSADGVLELASAADRIKNEVFDELSLVREVEANISAMLAASAQANASLTEQAEMVESAVASMCTIFQVVGSTVGVAKDGSSVAQAMLAIAEEGERTLTRTSVGIARTAEAGSRISEIAGLISDVADKTNLLAMNAAIEAAHAGSSGRGFAVVAGEIRKLAETTQSNARQIDAVLKTVTDGIKTVSEGSSSLGASLKAVVANAESTASISKRILSAMEEEAAAADSVSANINRLTSMTIEIKTAGLEQTAGAADISQALGRLKEQSSLIGSLTDAQAGKAQELRAQIDRLYSVVESHTKIIDDLDKAVAEF